MALGDVVICKDGRRFTGQVILDQRGYVIYTRLGIAMVPEHEVAEWIRRDDSEPPKPATSPVPPPATRMAVVVQPPPSDPPPATRPVAVDDPPIARIDPTPLPRPQWTPRPRPSDPRTPARTRYAGAFPIAHDLLVTSAAALSGARTIQAQAPDGTSVKVSLLQKDDASGLALLRVQGLRMAYFGLEQKFTAGQVTCPAFCEIDVFDPKPQLLVGQADGGRGVAKFNKHPGLAGSPVLSEGRVVGVELTSSDSPADNIPMATLDQLRALAGPRAGESPKAFTDPRNAMYQVIAD